MDESAGSERGDGRMRIPNEAQIEAIRKAYPSGTRVELVFMDDPQAPPAGTKGTIVDVDDIGSLIMLWDNGSGLNVVYGKDHVKKIKEEDHAAVCE